LCVPIPYPLLVVVASLAGAAARARGKGSFFNGAKVRELRDSYQIFDGSRAERDFGFRASLDLDTGLEAAVAWHMARGRR
jgi:nucleoside-diphosphate-sugar epimerase